MKIWTNEHIFNHKWESVAQNQFRKFPNPHNTQVQATDTFERHVCAEGKLHSHRLITSDWGLASWVQKLLMIGDNSLTHGYEYSIVDPKMKTMEMTSINLTFCNFVSMREHIKYAPDPEDPTNKTKMTHEMVVTVRNVPLTTYMESLVLNTVSNNAGKGLAGLDFIIEKFKDETKSLTESLESLKLDVIDIQRASDLVTDIKDLVPDNLIKTAQISIQELQEKIRPKLLQAEQPSHHSSVENPNL
jgi:archaellum component FlaC